MISGDHVINRDEVNTWLVHIIHSVTQVFEYLESIRIYSERIIASVRECLYVCVCMFVCVCLCVYVCVSALEAMNN